MQTIYIPQIYTVLYYRRFYTDYYIFGILLRCHRRSESPIITQLQFNEIIVNHVLFVGPVRSNIYYSIITHNPQIRNGFRLMRQQIYFLYGQQRFRWVLWNMTIAIVLDNRLRRIESQRESLTENEQNLPAITYIRHIQNFRQEIRITIAIYGFRTFVPDSLLDIIDSFINACTIRLERNRLTNNIHDLEEHIYRLAFLRSMRQIAHPYFIPTTDT
jgi:hypothetical protein